MLRIFLSLVFVLGLLQGNSTYAAKPSITRIEPAFWWAGMVSPQLELLVYGPKIAELEARIQHPGVSLTGHVRLENPNYLFLQLQLAPDVQPGSFKIEFQLRGKTVLTHAYELKARREGAAQREGFGPQDMLFLITPDRFANGDPTNDNSPLCTERANRAEVGGRHGGDIRGMIEQLPYLERMGVTALWINPLLENNMPVYSYHGYSTTDYYRIDPRFGSNDDYCLLSEKAAEKGIKIIMDQIANHCGREHWWMKDLPSKDWFNFGGQFSPCSHQRTTLQDKYAAEDDRLNHTDGWFSRNMPDLNQRHPQLARYLIQNSIWWVEYANLGGIRQDTYPYPDKDFMSQWAAAILAEYPKLNIVGEEWSTNPVITSYWQRGKQNHDGYQSNLPSLMDFPLQEALVQALNTPNEGWSTGLIRLYQMLANDFLYPAPNNLVVFPDNHDMSRIYTQLGEDYAMWKNAMVYFATVRGIPQIFYGTEILMKNPGTEDHGVIRSDFPGGFPGDSINAFTGQGLSPQQAEAQAFFSKLFSWRKTATLVHRGELLHYAPEEARYVFFRYLDAKRIMVVLNKNPEDGTLNPARFHQILGSATHATDLLTGQRISLTQPIPLVARTPLLLEIE